MSPPPTPSPFASVANVPLPSARSEVRRDQVHGVVKQVLRDRRIQSVICEAQPNGLFVVKPT